MTHYFKVEKGTDTFNKIADLFSRVNSTNKILIEFAKRVGSAKGGVMTSGFYAAGDVIGFQLEAKPENWKAVNTKYENGFYFPKSHKNNKELLGEIYALPKIKKQEFNMVVNMPIVHFKPGLALHDDYALIAVPVEWVGTYDPFPDMIEITGSVYTELNVPIVSKKLTK